MREPEFLSIVKTKNPILRFIGNFFGLLSAWALLKAVYAEEDNKNIKYLFYSKIFSILFPLAKWQTTYKFNMKDLDTDEELD